ncbi:hypothetical protein EUV02_05140 [Polymorphobacter arshaanensis]|uniref:YdhG-like domain-containing protein n=1 Tax=Glacieibacterium arshaanense TaxID=2511025 RepID=A0A4Y9ETZ5_9SPHN|nr:YdeI/OmpD-associated family protein [Polymorphobacter arshaanensis]TFU06378.1 hypothetical protein EUV02_05140 [Polymorphobacter arshaanensis]
MNRDPRIDAYIARAVPFAQPMLTRLRDALHAAASLDETIKWGMPAFTYKGAQVANIAGFKAHVTCNFWRRDAVGEAAPEVVANEKAAMGQFGRMTCLADIPDDKTIAAIVTRAIAKIDAGATTPRPAKRTKPEIAMPDDFAAALTANSGARTHFDAFPPGARRDYLEWITDAKRADTRARRIEQAVQWIAEGKRHNWQYVSC